MIATMEPISWSVDQGGVCQSRSEMKGPSGLKKSIQIKCLGTGVARAFLDVVVPFRRNLALSSPHSSISYVTDRIVLGRMMEAESDPDFCCAMSRRLTSPLYCRHKRVLEVDSFLALPARPGTISTIVRHNNISLLLCMKNILSPFSMLRWAPRWRTPY